MKIGKRFVRSGIKYECVGYRGKNVMRVRRLDTGEVSHISADDGEARQREERKARQRKKEEARQREEREVRQRKKEEARQREEREVRQRKEEEARQREEREVRQRKEEAARQRGEKRAREREERKARQREEEEARQREKEEAPASRPPLLSKKEIRQICEALKEYGRSLRPRVARQSEESDLNRRLREEVNRLIESVPALSELAHDTHPLSWQSKPKIGESLDSVVKRFCGVVFDSREYGDTPDACIIAVRVQDRLCWARVSESRIVEILENPQ